jgi:predicted ATPase
MAERYTAMLRSHTGKITLDVWRAYADCFDGERLIRCGDLDTGLSLLCPAIDELWRAGFVQYHTPFVVALALGFVHVGGAADAPVTIDAALERCERTGEGWALAELLRVRGELLLLEGAPGAAAAAADHYQRSLDWGPVLGTARRHEPCPAAEQSGPFRRCDGTPPAGL